MIITGPLWITIIPTGLESRDDLDDLPLDIDGKWLCSGPTEELHLYTNLLDRLVEERAFRAVKLTRKDPETDPFPHKDCAVCVYTSADPGEIDHVARQLRDIGLQPASWKSEEETAQDWSVAGKLFLEWQIMTEKRRRGLIAAGGDASEPTQETTYAKLMPDSPAVRKPLPAKTTAPPSTTRPQVFISYRRESGSEVARLLRGELTHRGYDVFLDVENLSPGLFDRVLLTEIEAAENFVLILSPRCLERCEVQGDWLRNEIEHAISKERNIVPIIMPGFEYPDPHTLSESIRPISFLHGIKYSHEFFDAMLEKMIQHLRAAAPDR